MTVLGSDKPLSPMPVVAESFGTAKDPRCPFCGRPVIGEGVVGEEGTYHGACVQPPQDRKWAWEYVPVTGRLTEAGTQFDYKVA